MKPTKGYADAEMERQTKRVQELFEPVHDQITKEGLDVIGALYAINMDLVLRDATMGVPARKFDAVFNQHYDRTLNAIAEMIDKAYDISNRIKARKAKAAKQPQRKRSPK